MTEAYVLILGGGCHAAVNPPGLFERVRPGSVIFPIDAENNEGLPSPLVLTVLQGIPVLRTDLNGWISVRTYGEGLWVEVEHAAQSAD